MVREGYNFYIAAETFVHTKPVIIKEGKELRKIYEDINRESDLNGCDVSYYILIKGSIDERTAASQFPNLMAATRLYLLETGSDSLKNLKSNIQGQTISDDTLKTLLKQRLLRKDAARSSLSAEEMQELESLGGRH